MNRPTNRSNISAMVAAWSFVLLLGGCPPTGGSSNNGNPDPEPEPDPEPRPTATAEIGFTDPSNGQYGPVGNGQLMPMFTGGQGGSHIFATLRARGFPISPDGSSSIIIEEVITLSPDAKVLHNFTQTVRFTRIDETTVEVADRFTFLDELPENLDGRTVAIGYNLVSEADPTIRASIVQTLVVRMQ